MSTDRIDAHHHLWDLTVRPQEWTVGLPPLDRSWVLADLEPLLQQAGVDGTVLVETVNIEPETAEFLVLADAHPAVRGVVGWVDLTAADVDDRIAALQAGPGGSSLKGLRHQVQLEPDPDWLRRPEVLRGLTAVAQAGLAFDLLVTPPQLPAAIAAVQQVPSGRFILDHAGKPRIGGDDVDTWATQVTELAQAGQVACKLSGLVTEAPAGWALGDLQPIADHVLTAFGPDRVLAGSDWPVCLLAADYATVWDLNQDLIADLSPAERDAVLGGAAIQWYRL